MIDVSSWAQESAPLTREAATCSGVMELFTRTARRFQHSRDRIRLCQQVRRNLITVYADQTWTDQYGEDAAEWIEPALPERQTLIKNLTNALSDATPKIVRRRTRESDRASADAEQLEDFLNAALEALYDFEATIEIAVEDAEFLTLVLPEPAALLACPSYMEPDGKGGRKPREKYAQSDSQRSGITQHKRDMQRHFADNPPIVVRQVSALDCAPILVHGRRGKRFECVGAVVRTLYDVEELLQAGYRWSKKVGERLLIPRGFGSGDAYGREGQVYLYEAFLMSKDDDGNQRPFIAYSVGGRSTWDTYSQGDTEQDDSAVVIDLYEEYGVDFPLWTYSWGIHSADPDPDHRGIPFLYPLVPSILNAEGFLLDHNAQAHENAFSGHVAELPPGENAESWMQGGKVVPLQKPKIGEIMPVPGPVRPFVGAPAGPDAEYLEQFYMRLLRENTPDEAQFGGSGSGSSQSSGRQLVVQHGLFETAHRQIPGCGLEVAQFVAKTMLRLMCGLSEGTWKGMKAGVNLAFDVNVEAQPGADDREATQLIEFNPRWVGESYDCSAVYPNTGNIAEVGQTSELYDKGQASWDDLMEVRGKSNPQAERIKIRLDKYWDSEQGQAELLDYAMKRSGRMEEQQARELQQQGELTAGGMPSAVLAPEAQQAPLGQMQTAPGQIGQQVLGSEISAGMGTGGLGQEAMMASQVGGGGMPTGGI